MLRLPWDNGAGAGEVDVAGTIDNLQFHDLFLQQPQGPARASLGRLGTSQGNQFGFLLAVKNPSNPRCRPLLATQDSLEAFLRQLLSHPVNHRNAGAQSLDDPAVAPTCTGFRDIGLQQYSRLQQPLRRALAFPYQRFKPFAFLAAQPNNILLYRNLLGSHDRLRRPRCDGIESQNHLHFKLIEAGDWRRSPPTIANWLMTPAEY